MGAHARDRLLAMHGCPTTQRASVLAMGRIAYGVGLAGVSWAAALVGELNPTPLTVRNGSPSAVAVALVHHAGPALLLVLPIVVACAVFAPKAPHQRHLAALLFAPLAFATTLFVHFGLYWQFGSAEDRPDDLPSFVGALLFLTIPALFMTAVAALPLTPILSFARAGDSDDHDARARLRVGASLAVASALQFVAIALLLASEPAELWEPPFYAVASAPPAAAFVFGLVEVVKSRRVLASLGDWLSRVRGGAVRGVRIRDVEVADSALYVPDLVRAGPLVEDLQVLEAYADYPEAGPYRMKRSSVPLGRVPRE